MVSCIQISKWHFQKNGCKSFSSGTQGIEKLVHDIEPNVLLNFDRLGLHDLSLGPYTINLSDKYVETFMDCMKINTRKIVITVTPHSAVRVATTKINLTQLHPCIISSLWHWHLVQELYEKRKRKKMKKKKLFGCFFFFFRLFLCVWIRVGDLVEFCYQITEIW